MKEYRILSPSGILGYGFPEESFRRGVEMHPDLIACDGGSTDPGPYYLGSGKPFTNETAVERDLRLMLDAAMELHIPLVIGTAGGSGADVHVAREVGIVRRIAAEKGYSFKMAVISAELDKHFLKEELAAGHIRPLGPVDPLTEKDIDESTGIVAQMGVEPIIEALKAGAQVILCGRCYDPAAFAAPAILAGYDRALAVHLGKILECAAICAVPGSACDCVIGCLREDSFTVEPLNPARKCTPLSVSAHTLYEKSDPCLLPGPGGTLDLRNCIFEAEGDRCTRVSGSRFIPEEKSTVKLEGARLTGYRTISVCGNRDALFIRELDTILADVKQTTAENFSAQDFKYELSFIVYGRDGVMGPLEPAPVPEGHEVGIIIDAVADTQEHADAVCAVARSTMLHYGYRGRIATAGNLAFPFSPSDLKAGSVYTFSVYHLLESDDPASLFPRTYLFFENGEEVPEKEIMNGEITEQRIQELKIEDRGVTEQRIQELKTQVQDGNTAECSALTGRETPGPDDSGSAKECADAVSVNAPVSKYRLRDIASVIRTKNSGPYELTMDIMFKEEELYRRAEAANIISVPLIAELYHIPENEVLKIVYFPKAKAIKATIVRPIASGALGERDVYGAQQHAPLMDLVVEM